MKPFRMGRLWYVRVPSTIHFLPFLSRAEARAYCRRAASRRWAVEHANLVGA